MKYCNNCLNTTTRPNVKFNNQGLCFPCAAFKNKKFDWGVREKILNKIILFAQKNKKSGYDCIVGVSGGKDSTRQAIHIKEQFGLQPLLVSMNYPPEQISQRGVDNLSNLIRQGFSCVNISCSPQIWRKAMRYAFFKFGNWAKSTEFALFASVPRLAIAYQIPLIFWGENPSFLLGEMGTRSSKPYDGSKMKNSNTLAGGGLDWLVEAGFTSNQLLQYVYPSDREMKRAKLKIVYMDYFMEEFSIFLNGNFSALRGLSIKKPDPNKDPDYYGTNMVDEDFFNINMHIRYLKFGFGRTSDNVNVDIRYGRLTRQQGIDLVEKFDHKYDPKILNKFCEYLDISKKMFWSTVDKYVNTKLFDKIAIGKYKPKFKVGIGI